MNLFAVVVGGVYPPQCVVVWDRESSARALSEHLNATVRDVTEVRAVDSFYPRGMTEADSVWIRATGAFLQGAHHNASA